MYDEVSIRKEIYGRTDEDAWSVWNDRLGSRPDIKPRRLQRPLCRGNQTSIAGVPIFGALASANER